MTTLDPRDLHAADAVVGSDEAMQPGISADRFDLDAGQRSMCVALAMLWCAAALARAISVVVALRPEEQMSDVDARWVVAVVEHAHPRRDVAVNRGPSQAMSEVSLAADDALAVAMLGAGACGLDARGHEGNLHDGGT